MVPGGQVGRPCGAGMRVCSLPGPRLRLASWPLPDSHPCGCPAPGPEGGPALPSSVPQSVEGQGLVRLGEDTRCSPFPGGPAVSPQPRATLLPARPRGCLLASSPLLTTVLCLARPQGPSRPMLMQPILQGSAQCHLYLEALRILGFPPTSLLPASPSTMVSGTSWSLPPTSPTASCPSPCRRGEALTRK